MSNDTEEGRKNHSDRLMKFAERIHAAILQQEEVIWTRMRPSTGEIWVQMRDEHEFTLKIESFDASTTPKV